MSTIGRIFIILNLVLAGVFVGFASTYLQSAADWKKKHNEVVASAADTKKVLEEQLQAEAAKSARLDSQLASSQAKLKSLESTNSTLVDENRQLDARLSTLDGAMQTMKSDLGTISSSLEKAQSEYTNSVKLALEATSQRDEAQRVRDTAVADLSDANNVIKSLREDLEMRDANLAKASSTNKEQAMLLAAIQAKFPDINLSVLAQPALKGTVRRADGDLLTIVVTDNPASADIRPGIRFAVAGDKGYKGEALVTEVEGNNAFCRMVLRNGDSEIAVGDAAMTQTH
ncbi:MAG: hypothetical protein KDB80_00655 [Planctomycetes bacterium]|nr:hypothetical protein [Planctomycetota bacterium]